MDEKRPFPWKYKLHVLLLLCGLAMLPIAAYTQYTIDEESLLQKRLEANKLLHTQPEEAKAMLDEILLVAKQMNFKEGVYFTNESIGMHHYLRDEMDQAIETYQRTVDLAAEMDSVLLMGYGIQHMANVYMRIRRFDKASELLGQARDIFLQENNVFEQANVIGSLATIASRTGKIEEALAGHAQAYALFESLNAEKSMATCDLNISYIYLMADEGEKAIPHIERSLAYYEKVDYTRGVAMGYGNLAYAFSLVGNFSAAFENYETSVAVAEENDWAGIVKDTYKDMSDTYLKAGDADQALIYFKKYHVIQDSLIGQETQQRIADLEVEFETERKEQQIIKLEQENSIQTLRMQLLIGGAVLLAVIGLLVFTRMRENLKKKQALIQKNELIHKLEKELIENQLHQKQLEQEQMEAQLAYKTKHLTDFALDIAQKNQFSNDLLLAIKGIEVGNIPKKVSDQLRQIRTFISSNLQINEELATFQQNVDEVHLEFNRKLQERYPELSQKDTILCGLLRLQLQNKEIATIRGVSDKAIKMARYRLRKKLGLKENEEITSFLKTI